MDWWIASVASILFLLLQGHYPMVKKIAFTGRRADLQSKSMEINGEHNH